MPTGDFHVVVLETDQGLALTRMVVVGNEDEVTWLGQSIRMQGGDGNMGRNVQRFSPAIEKAALAIITASITYLQPDIAFGQKSGDVGYITAAGRAI